MRAYIFSHDGYQREKDSVIKFTVSSLAAHLIIISVIIGVGSWLKMHTTLDMNTIEAQLVRFGEKPRDPKLLPRIYKKEKPAAAAKDEKGNSVTQKETDKKKEKKEEKKEVNLDKLLSSAMEDIKEDARAEKTKEGDKSGVRNGEVINPALAIKGNMYIREINSIIRENWKIPGIIAKDTLSRLKTEISFRITFSGEIYDIAVITDSENKIFDSSVIEAIKKTVKLPLPADKELKKYVLKEGLQWVFTPGT